MPEHPFARFAAQPPDIAAWEELLLRYELGPRALSNALELHVLPAAGEPLPLVSRVAEEEALAMEWLGALRDGAEAPAGWSAGTPRADEPWEDALERFTQLRGRNFGALQRRGLEVWDWKARHGEHGEVTAFQFLSAAVRRDAANLASARTLSAAGREAEC